MPEADDKQAAKAAKARWVHTLSGPWSVETYGIVEFLRVHPACRWIMGALGVAACATAFAAWGFDVKILGFTFSFLPFFILGPVLLYLATISGQHFEVTFPPRQAAQEREKAERTFEESKTLQDALKLDFSRLNEYYVINQGQARSSFRWAVCSMLLGFGTIIAGIWLFYFRGGQPDTFMASLSTAAGCVVNLVSALFLYLHSQIQTRSLHYYDQLSRLQHLSIAIRLAEAHENQEAKQEARNLIIRQLVLASKPVSESPAMTANKALQATAAAAGS